MEFILNKKCLNIGIISSLIIFSGFLCNSVEAMTFTFQQNGFNTIRSLGSSSGNTYNGKSGRIRGQFKGKDLDNNGIINTNEIENTNAIFEATVKLENSQDLFAIEDFKFSKNNLQEIEFDIKVSNEFDLLCLMFNQFNHLICQRLKSFLRCRSFSPVIISDQRFSSKALGLYF